MDIEPEAIAAMSAVTISRTYGSGGGEIAARLARKLGWQLVDHEIVAQVARRLEISEAEAEAGDERGEGLIEKILNSLRVAYPSEFVMPAPVPVQDSAELYREALRAVVEGAVQTRHVVVVGRGAQVLLAGRRDILNTRIVAPLEERVRYVAVREGLNGAAARDRIQLKDRDRVHYLQSQFHHDVNDPLLYDLVVNTAVLDLNHVVDLIILALSDKGQQLRVPVDQLGPGAGLGRYPGRPEDLRPPGLTA